MDQPPSSWLSFFFIEFPPSPHQATLSYSLILPLKCPGTSVHIKVGFSSCWTRFPIALVYCWLKSVLTILTSVRLRLSLTPSYPVLPSMLASTSSPLNCPPRPPHLIPYTQDLPSEVLLSPHAPALPASLYSPTSSSWSSPFFDLLYHLDMVLLPGEIRYAMSYFFVCRDLVSASDLGLLRTRTISHASLCTQASRRLVQWAAQSGCCQWCCRISNCPIVALPVFP